MKNIKTNPLFNTKTDISIGSVVDLEVFKTGLKPRNNDLANQECSYDCQYKDKDSMCVANCPHLAFTYNEQDSNNTESDSEQLNFVFVEFNGNRRDIFFNNRQISINKGDKIIVSIEAGIDIGKASNTILISKDETSERYIKAMQQQVVRIATDTDIESENNNKLDEKDLMQKIKLMPVNFGLDMKIVDVEWQFDRRKLTIFFTAPQRIDFRELVKELAKQFRSRIELRQINAREEVKRKSDSIGGCGKKLCCTVFNSNTNDITVEHAKLQQLSNNTSKLSGYCNRIKCCMVYEYDFYEKELMHYPPLNSIIQTDKLKLKLVKIDVFKHIATLYNIDERIYTAMNRAELDKLIKSGKVILPTILEDKIEIDEDVIIDDSF